MSYLRDGWSVGVRAVLLGVAILPCAARGAGPPLREVVDAESRPPGSARRSPPRSRPPTPSSSAASPSTSSASSRPTRRRSRSSTARTRTSASKLIDKLLADPRFAQHQADVWDLVLFGRNPPGYDTDKRDGFQTWLRSRFEKNVPYDEWARELLKAEGNSVENGGPVLRPVPQRPGGRDRGRHARPSSASSSSAPAATTTPSRVEAARLLRHGRVPRPARRRRPSARRGT